jgi:hypothetical protein
MVTSAEGWELSGLRTEVEPMPLTSIANATSGGSPASSAAGTDGEPRASTCEIEITPAMVRSGMAELERRLFDLHCDPVPRVYSEVVVVVYLAMSGVIHES